MPKIMFTGGGSAGHVTVNLALIPKFREEGWSIGYIGSEQGIEKQLTASVSGLPYYSISTGKLRRYLDWNNIKDPFKVVKGAVQAYRIIRRERPQVIFSKVGFVSVPVIVGAWFNRVPVVIHESDITPGLANRLSLPMAKKVCLTFPETSRHLRTDKAVHVGAVVREELLAGNASRGLAFCSFSRTKPVLLIMGGSLGAHRINLAVRDNLDALAQQFQIVHLCGKGNLDPSINRREYKQYEYLQQELPDALAMTDLVVTRAGANSIFEFLALRKPMLMIPLSRQQSRGDQIINARSFRQAGFGEMLEEDALTDESFLEALSRIQGNRARYVEAMEAAEQGDALGKIIDVIKQTARL